MQLNLLFEFTNHLDADDEFKYSSGGIEELILQVTSAETNDIWVCIATMEQSFKCLTLSSPRELLLNALEALNIFRNKVEVLDEEWRVETCREEFSCNSSLCQLQLDFLSEKLGIVLRRYLPLHGAISDEEKWPHHWTTDDIADAQTQNYEGFVDPAPRQLVFRLFFEDIQLIVSLSTSAGVALLDRTRNNLF
jgi:hypothetical protein